MTILETKKNQKWFQPILLIIIPKGLVDMVIYADSISVFLVEMRKQFDDFFSFFSGGNTGIPLSIGYTMGPKYFLSHIQIWDFKKQN